MEIFTGDAYFREPSRTSSDSLVLAIHRSSPDPSLGSPFTVLPKQLYRAKTELNERLGISVTDRLYKLNWVLTDP